MHIEQAIFTSAKSDRASGYHLVARSPGITEIDARDLAAWGPSHDSLLDSEAGTLREEPFSDNFFPLACGAYCISRTTAAGAEYSQRGGVQVYTQCLVLHPDTLARFANNPLAVLRAATASGAITVLEHIPAALPAIELGGRTPPVDRAILAQACSELGATVIARLVAAALANPALSIAGARAELAITALLNCLPVACRLPFSFSTGLKHSARRPFRLLGIGEDRNHAALLARHQGIAEFDLHSARGSGALSPTTGWGGFIAAVLTNGKLPMLISEISNPQFGHALDELDARGDELLARLFGPAHTPGSVPAKEPAAEPVEITNLQRADAAHQRFASQTAVSANAIATVQSSSMPTTTAVTTASDRLRADKKLSAQTPEVIEMLEHLDDVVFAAIEGQAAALEQVEVVWALVLDELGAELVEESREQYLRYALQVWNQCLAGEVSDPERAVAAVDVMCLLFGH